NGSATFITAESIPAMPDPSTAARRTHRPRADPIVIPPGAGTTALSDPSTPDLPLGHGRHLRARTSRRTAPHSTDGASGPSHLHVRFSGRTWPEGPGHTPPWLSSAAGLDLWDRYPKISSVEYLGQQPNNLRGQGESRPARGAPV